jgi:PAS domain S-box-containing protein
LDPHDGKVPKLFIGYVRLRVSTEGVKQSVAEAVIVNILAAVLLTGIAVVVLNLFVGKYVLKPILTLHQSISRHKEGEFYKTVPVHANDEIGGLFSEFNAMTLVLKEREEKLAEEKERLGVTLRSIGDAVIVTDVAGTVTMINKAAEQLTGWTAEEAVGSPLSGVFHVINEKTRERIDHPVEKVISSGLVCGLSNHTAIIRKDGREIVIEDSAAPIRDKSSRIVGVVLVFRDTTDKRRIEEEMLKSEKLQSVGVLAGGLAHDFNNLLTAVLGNISMAKMYVDSRSKAFARLSEAESASRRATDLTYQLLTFSRGGAPIKKTASISDIIRESANFTLSGTNVAAHFRIAELVWAVNVDSGQISQVFNNLIINAVQAMPDGGTVFITVENIVLQENSVATLPAGPHVRITVQDTGSGIPEENLPKIFDPYFTTKQHGSGLGLASVYSIVKRHNGHVAVESKAGHGTTFQIYLPASGGMSAESPAGETGIVQGHGRILVMDDEQIVRDVSGDMLQALGYEVACAKTGMEAVELYCCAREENKPFQAVIMDLTIPGGMGGRDAVKKLLAVDPDVKAIVSSGYSNDPIMANYKKFGFKGVIIKPYNIDAFSKILREVL